MFQIGPNAPYGRKSLISIKVMQKMDLCSPITVTLKFLLQRAFWLPFNKIVSKVCLYDQK